VAWWCAHCRAFQLPPTSVSGFECIVAHQDFKITVNGANVAGALTPGVSLQELQDDKQGLVSVNTCAQ
jgi:hypothetical protein